MGLSPCSENGRHLHTFSNLHHLIASSFILKSLFCASTAQDTKLAWSARSAGVVSCRLVSAFAAALINLLE